MVEGRRKAADFAGQAQNLEFAKKGNAGLRMREAAQQGIMRAVSSDQIKRLIGKSESGEALRQLVYIEADAMGTYHSRVDHYPRAAGHGEKIHQMRGKRGEDNAGLYTLAVFQVISRTWPRNRF
jgi:hypothetical protein